MTRWGAGDYKMFSTSTWNCTTRVTLTRDSGGFLEQGRCRVDRIVNINININMSISISLSILIPNSIKLLSTSKAIFFSNNWFLNNSEC